MAVDGPDDDLVLGELPQPGDDEPAAVAGRVFAVISLVHVDEAVVLRAASNKRMCSMIDLQC